MPEEARDEVYWFTPTGVGKTYPPIHGRQAIKVHPHGCGEDRALLMPDIKPGGSPPRVWGRPKRNPQHSQDRRFTPTGVGKTRTKSPFAHINPVHPHGCGEDLVWPEYKPPVKGSPPRVWGRRAPAPRPARSKRFTPTGVGKTIQAGSSPATLLVHPHGCGEDAAANWKSHLWNGSPPRVWGRQGARDPAFRYRRFTPTGVGKTYHAPPRAQGPSVHPHGCGEDDAIRAQRTEAGGSPPRVWGRRAIGDFAKGEEGFTPTGVGKTAMPSPTHRTP